MVDGNDIRDYKLSYLRSHIATVLQDVFLFSDSIANNINLSNEEIGGIGSFRLQKRWVLMNLL